MAIVFNLVGPSVEDSPLNLAPSVAFWLPRGFLFMLIVGCMSKRLKRDVTARKIVAMLHWRHLRYVRLLRLAEAQSEIDEAQISVLIAEWATTRNAAELASRILYDRAL